jgi:riboflavin biosynthesis pyrimidine reductase
LRSLIPEGAGPVDLAETYSRELPELRDRPFVRVNMVFTFDGAVSLGGRAKDLSGPADRSLFQVLRSLADLVLVGAGTVRAENYGPVKLPDEVQQTRAARGQSRLPRLAIVTRSMNLDFESRLFTGGGNKPGGEDKPIVIAPSAAVTRAPGKADKVAEVLPSGAQAVDLRSALDGLRQRGLKHILCEGGPALNDSLLGASLVDELCLTCSPKLVVGSEEGVVRGWSQRHGPTAVVPTGSRLEDLDLVHLLEEDGFLFLRLRIR